MTGADLTDAALAFNVNLANADLSGASLVGASFGTCFVAQGTPTLQGVACFNPTLTGTTLAGAKLNSATIAYLSGVNLTDADLSSASGPGCFTFDVVVGDDSTKTTDCLGMNLSSANLTDANLSNADLSNASLASATLTGATFTGTSLVPPNQTVSATSGAGAPVTWPTPPSVPGASPGACTPPSGSTFPLGTSTVTCQVLDAANDVATGTFQVNVQPFTHVLAPLERRHVDWCRPPRCSSRRYAGDQIGPLRGQRGDAQRSGRGHRRSHHLRLGGQVEHHECAQRHLHAAERCHRRHCQH